MLIRLNGEPRPVPDGFALVQLLDELVGADNRKGVAVARNFELVRRTDWDTVRLEDGDAIEIVRATQGG